MPTAATRPGLGMMVGRAGPPSQRGPPPRGALRKMCTRIFFSFFSGDDDYIIKMIMDVEALLEESSRREIGRPQVAPPSWSGQQN